MITDSKTHDLLGNTRTLIHTEESRFISRITLVFCFLICAPWVYGDNHVKLDSIVNYAKFNYQINPDSTLILCTLGERLALDDENYWRAGQCANIAGLAYSMQSKYDSSLWSLHKAVHWAIRADSSRLLALAHSNLARIHLVLSNFDSSVQYYQKVLPFYQTLGDSTSLGSINASLGKVYVYLEELDKALSFQDKALQYLKDSPQNYRLLGSIHNTLGYIYDEQEKYEKAVEAYGTSVTYRELSGDEVGMLYTQTNLCVAYRNLKQDQKAYDCNITSLDLSRQLKITNIEAVNLLNVGINLSDLGRYSESNNYLDTAGPLLLKEHDFNNLGELEGMYSFNYEKLGDFKSALQHYKFFKNWEDSLLNVKKYQAVEELRAKYADEQREIENQLLAEETRNQQVEIKRKQDQISAISIIGLLLIGLGILIFNRYKSRKQIEIAEKELELQSAVTIAEMDSREAERKRIARELHDGIGQQLTGISIQFGVYDDQPDKKEVIEELIANMAGDIRSLAHEMMPQALTRLGLVAAIQDLAEISTSEAVKCSFDYEGEFNDLSETETVNVYRIVQESLSNALKHAKCSKIRIHLKRIKNHVKLTCSDDGVGFAGAGQSGLGVSGMKARAKRIGGELIIQNTGSGTDVVLNWRKAIS